MHRRFKQPPLLWSLEDRVTAGYRAQLTSVYKTACLLKKKLSSVTQLKLQDDSSYYIWWKWPNFNKPPTWNLIQIVIFKVSESNQKNLPYIINYLIPQWVHANRMYPTNLLYLQWTKTRNLNTTQRTMVPRFQTSLYQLDENLGPGDGGKPGEPPEGVK